MSGSLCQAEFCIQSKTISTSLLHILSLACLLQVTILYATRMRVPIRSQEFSKHCCLSTNPPSLQKSVTTEIIANHIPQIIEFHLNNIMGISKINNTYEISGTQYSELIIVLPFAKAFVSGTTSEVARLRRDTKFPLTVAISSCSSFGTRVL